MKILFALLIAFLIFSTETKGSDLPQFRHVTIDNKVKIGYGVAIADMNADKKRTLFYVMQKILLGMKTHPGKNT